MKAWMTSDELRDLATERDDAWLLELHKGPDVGEGAGGAQPVLAALHLVPSVPSRASSSNARGVDESPCRASTTAPGGTPRPAAGSTFEDAA